MTEPRIPSMLDQLMAAAAVKPDVKAWPANPFPCGFRAGSTTDRVLQALKAEHPRWMEHWELMVKTGRSRGAVTWALVYLLDHGLVQSIPSSRNPQYRRYRAVEGRG